MTGTDTETRSRCRRSRAGRLAASVAALAVATGLAGCSSIEYAGQQPDAARADRSFDIQVSRVMRGTIASETVLRGYQPVIVHGWGLVVGLNGTGSRNVEPSLRAHMLAEMARRGVGQDSTGMGYIKPEAMLDSPDTAVVIVEGILPPGAVGRVSRLGRHVSGTSFDVRISADPRTDTTSLEGGRLYTCELFPAGQGQRFPMTGSRQPAPIAAARGPIFVNPFAEPGALERDSVSRTSGRILGGGEVLRDMVVKLRLATPSHARAQIIQGAVNARFPREPGQKDETARGESEELIEITVPPSFRESPNDFIELLRHTSIRQAGIESISASIRRIVQNDPAMASSASWRWQALGPRSLPTIRDLYTYPEEKPRLAALRAGARLDDPLVIPPLTEMVTSASAEARLEAVVLLGAMRLDPRIDRALRNVLNDGDIDVRLAAYEALVQKADPSITRRVVDDRFVLDVIDSDRPLIYVTQVKQPRIAIFGSDLAVSRPALVDAWSGRFMLQAKAGDEEVEVYYRAEDTGERMIQSTSARLEDFVQFLGHRTTVETPAPGLGLSYSETVGALHQVWRQGYLTADFKADQDRVLAAIIRQRDEQVVEQRAEFDPEYEPPPPPLEPGMAPTGSEFDAATGVGLEATIPDLPARDADP